MKLLFARLATHRNQLWQWFVRHAESKHALGWLGIIAFFDTIFLPIAPEIFMVALMLAHPKRWKAYLAIALTASIAGAIVSYFIAYFLFTQLGPLLLRSDAMQHAFLAAQHLFGSHIFLTMVTTSFTPVPDKLFIYAAGFLQVNFFLFIAGHFVGRGARMAALLYLTGRYGKHVIDIVDRYFLWFGGAVLALGVLYAIVWWCILPFLG